MELKKIGILSLAKITGIFGILYGLLSGILISFVYSQSGKIPAIIEQAPIIEQLGYSSLIILPVLNGIIYFIAGIILAWLYNLIAKKIGGIEFALEDKKRKK